MLLQLAQHVVMIVVGRQLHTQLETRRFEQPHQRRRGGAIRKPALDQSVMETGSARI